MLKALLSSLIKDLLKLLSGHKDFFAASASAREKILESEIPEIAAYFQDYFKEAEGKKVLKDLKNAILFAQKKEPPEGSNGLLKSLADYLSKKFALLLDEKKAPTPKKSHFTKTLAHILNIMDYREISQEIENFIHEIAAVPYTLVQSATHLDLREKNLIRQELQKKESLIFPIFQVNRSLIGGMRIFLAGKTHDESWFYKVNRLNQL